MSLVAVSQRRQPAKKCAIVTPTGGAPFEVEFSVHEPPKSFRKTDIEPAFPDAVAFRHQPLFCVVTFQLASYICDIGNETNENDISEECETSDAGSALNTFSMISTDDRTMGYKDVARERYFYFMTKIKEACEAAMHELNVGAASAAGGGDLLHGETAPSPSLWVDWTDPATGLPILGHSGPSTYCESDALEQLMVCEIVVVAGNGGACRMIQHERWGVDVYPATGFVSVPSFKVLQRGFDILLKYPEFKVVS
jgi:hypothetical protein